MRLTSRWLALPSLSLLSAAAVAQSDFYLFAAIGNSSASVNLGAGVGGLTYRVDDDRGSFTVGGGYEFNEYASVEAAFHDLGRQTGSGDCPPGSDCLLILPVPRVDAGALSMSFVGSFRISDRLDGCGRTDSLGA